MNKTPKHLDSMSSSTSVSSSTPSSKGLFSFFFSFLFGSNNLCLNASPPLLLALGVVNNKELDLQQIAAQTVTSLCEIWDDLGLEREERSGAIQQLCARVAAVYSGVLEAEEQRRKTSKQQIIDYTQSIQIVSKQLAEPCSDVGFFFFF
jgi:hypothetical protein